MAVGAVGTPVKAGESKGAAPVTSATGIVFVEDRIKPSPLVM